MNACEETTLILEKRYYFLWVTVLILLLDQATKLRVKSNLNIGESISVLGDFFRITLVTNPGAAFSLSLGSNAVNRLFFIISSSLAIVIFLYLLSKRNRRIVQYAYALILGGAVGNLIDRIAYGAVIDFFDFKFFTFIMERWPVFNIADSAIVLAVMLLLIDIFFPAKEKEGENQNFAMKTIEESL
jgi:signal peptidase II